MPNLAALAIGAADDLRPMGVAATVTRAPSSTTDTLDVEWFAPGDDGFEEAGGESCRWVTRYSTLPAVGDEAVLLIDSRGDPFALVWPAAASVDPAADIVALDARLDAIEAGPEAVIAPTLTNSWANFGAPYGNAGYYRDRGRVWLVGGIKTGVSNTSAFTLPAGYRPPAEVDRPILASGGVAQVVIATDGTVKPVNIGATSVAGAAVIDGASFRVA